MALEFIDEVLVKRWLHGPRIDEQRYAGSTAPATGTAHELISDRLGSVLGVVDVATGQLAGDYRYDAFGARTVTGEAIRYGFTGREHDASGLIYYRARHFDPQTGRFLQADPIGFAAGDLNIYAYVWNDPFNWTDPSGLSVTVDYVRWAAMVAGTAATLQCVQSGLCQEGMQQPPSVGGLGGIFGAVINLAQQIGMALITSFPPPPMPDVVNSESGQEQKVTKGNPPNHPDFKADKKKQGLRPIPWLGPGRKGYKDSKGNYWEPVVDGHKGTHAPHWDVQHPDGTHTPKYPI